MNELDIALGTHIDTASFIRRNLPEGNFRNIRENGEVLGICTFPAVMGIESGL